jgi:hypothetical protein
MKKTVTILLIGISLCTRIQAQGKIGVEQYNYLNAKPVLQPIVHIETARNWHMEFRYNYEDAETFSVYGGKKIERGDELEWSITPMIGFSAGKFNGISLAFNSEAEWKDFYFGSQTQYSHAFENDMESFFFSWSELGYSIHKNFYSGLAMQYTLQKGWSEFDPGFTAGLSFKNVQFPCYIFNPFKPGRYYILGFIYQFNLKGN